MHNSDVTKSLYSPYNQRTEGNPASNEGSSFVYPSLSSSEAIEEENNSGCDSSVIDNFLLSALDDSVHRLFVLKLEKEFLRFAMDPMIRMLEFPAMAPFPRLVIHRVAGYFRLSRSVRGASGNWRRSIVVFKTPESYIPALRLSDLLVKEKEPVKQMKILVRAPARGSEKSKDQKPHMPTPQTQTPPVRLMKRERKPVIISDSPAPKPPTPPLESETLNQREQAYALARARIFNEPLEQSLAQTSLSQEEGDAPIAIPSSTISSTRPTTEVAPVVAPVCEPETAIGPAPSDILGTQPARTEQPTNSTYPSGPSSGWSPLGQTYSPPFFEFQPSYAPTNDMNYGQHPPPRQTYAPPPQHPSPYQGAYPPMYHSQPPVYPYADMRNDPYANRRAHPPPPQGLMFDYSDMNSIPGPTEKEVHLPKHIVEFSDLAPDLRSLEDPRLGVLQNRDASIRILSHAKSADSPAMMVAVFKSNSAAAGAIQQINSPHFRLIPWTGKME